MPRSPKSPRLMLSLGTPAILQSDQDITPPEEVAACEDTAMWDQITFSSLLDAFMVTDDSINNCMASFPIHQSALTQIRSVELYSMFGPFHGQSTFCLFVTDRGVVSVSE
jgi:hypothetical protein